PEYPEYLALSDEEVPIEDQPYAAANSPIALSLGYIVDLDSKEDPKDESEDGPKNYPADGGDDDDDDSSGDDTDDEDEEEASKEEEDEEEEEEEHLAPTDSTAAASPVVDPVPSAEETEPFETDESAATPPPPPPAYHTTSRMSIRAQTPIAFPSEAKVDRLLVMPTPPPSILTPLSSPLPHIPLPPFHVPSPPTTSPTYIKAPLGYRAAMIRLRTASPPPLPLSSPLPLPPHILLPRTKASMVLMRAVAPSTYILAPRSRTLPSRTPPILTIPLPTSLLPLPLPNTNHRVNVPEAVLSPRKRLCIALGLRFEAEENCSTAATRSTKGFRADYGFVGTLDVEIRRNPDREVGYEITNVWVDPAEATEEIPPTTLAEFSQRVIDFVTNFSSTCYAEIDTTMPTLLYLLREARVAQEAWAQFMNASHRARSEKMPPRKAPRTRTTLATTTATTLMTNAAIRVLISQGKADALAKHEIQRNNNLNGDGSQGFGSSIIRPVRPTRECTYTDFLKCQPINFKGTKGVVGLAQWFEKIETVLNISNYAVENQVKFTTYTIHGVALTWSKSHIKKLEMEIWELKVKGTDLESYTQRFQELALLCGRMFPEESDKVKKYVGGLLDIIHGRVMASKQKIMHDAIEFPTELMDKKIRTYVAQNHWANQRGNGCYECGAQGHFKRECPKLKNNNRGNQGGNGNATAKVYAMGNAGIIQDSNVVTGMFLLNNRYASILFDTSVDRCFVSAAFNSLIDIITTTFDHYYDVKLAGEK
nr:hypothetical protein [Tanacetum cinerariifolium]